MGIKHESQIEEITIKSLKTKGRDISKKEQYP